MALLFSFEELIHLVVMTLALGFIFKDTFRKPLPEQYDPVAYFSRSQGQHQFWFAVAVVAPGIILHEMAHKFVALSFGLQAVFQASFFGLGLGIMLKLINFGFIIFVPGFVSIPGPALPWQHSLIA